MKKELDRVKKLLENNCIIEEYGTCIMFYDETKDRNVLLEKILWQRYSIDDATMEWIVNTTEEEREELKRLSKIAWHTKEIEKLQKHSPNKE